MTGQSNTGMQRRAATTRGNGVNAHLHNLGLLFEIRMKVVIALVHGRGLARRSIPRKVGGEWYDAG